MYTFPSFQKELCNKCVRVEIRTYAVIKCTYVLLTGLYPPGAAVSVLLTDLYPRTWGCSVSAFSANVDRAV